MIIETLADLTFWQFFWWYVAIRAITSGVKLVGVLFYCLITGNDFNITL